MSRLAARGLAVLAMLTMRSHVLAQEDPATGELATFAVGADGGYGFYQSATGGWTDVFVARELGLAERWAMQGELGVLLAWSTYTQTGVFHDGSVVEDNEDDNLGYGVLGRALLAFRASRPLVLRAGLVLGYAHVDFQSTICGSSATNGPTYGLSFAPALRLGGSRHVEVGATIEMLTFPFLLCGNAGRNPATDEPPWPIVVEPEEFFDDPGIIVSGRVAYRWF